MREKERDPREEGKRKREREGGKKGAWGERKRDHVARSQAMNLTVTQLLSRCPKEFRH